MPVRPHTALRWLAPVFAVGLTFLPGCFTNKQHQGERLYVQHCSGCHGEQGQGLGTLIPPLAGSDYLAQHRE